MRTYPYPAGLTPEQRLLARVTGYSPDECWPWWDRSDHGKIYIDGRGIGAHRFSYEMHYGPIPEGLVVRHRCDNPPCVNPAHLELGTVADNSRDCVERGRAVIPRTRGARHHASKLTDDQVPEIVALYAAGDVTQQQLAERFGVSQGVIAKVTAGKSWRHVDREPITVGRGQRLTEMPGRPS